MKKEDILYDHYKDTFLIQKSNEKTRNKLFVLLCIFILLLMLMVIYPNNIYDNIQELFLNKFGINIKFEIEVIEMFIWFIILYLTIRYYQINANIEKNYNYIHELENILNNKYKLQISREGKNYLNQYPLFLTLSYSFYKYVFPIIFILCLIVKNIYNFKNRTSLSLLLTVFITICLLIINISYIIFNYKLRKRDDKNGKA